MQSYKNDAEITLALDIGGTFIKSALFRNGGIVRRLESIPSRSESGKSEIASAIKQAIALAGSFSRLAVAIPGPFDYKRGIFRMAHKFAAVNGCSFEELSGGATGVFLHDANAFLLGEIAHGAARGFQAAGGITLGTGLGTALAINGNLLVDWDGSPASEVKLWNCPYRDGIAEDYISTRALLAKYPAESVKAIADAAENGDEKARKVWREYGDVFYELLSGWHRKLGPDVIVIGGQIGKNLALLGPGPADLPLRVSALEESAALYGVYEYSREKGENNHDE